MQRECGEVQRDIVQRIEEERDRENHWKGMKHRTRRLPSGKMYGKNKPMGTGMADRAERARRGEGRLGEEQGRDCPLTLTLIVNLPYTEQCTDSPGKPASLSVHELILFISMIDRTGDRLDCMDCGISPNTAATKFPPL